MAPELLNQEKHGRKIDVWSLGCTIIEMATANHPWYRALNLDVINRPDVKSYPELLLAVRGQKCPPIPEELSDKAKDFIRSCCQFDKKARPKVKDLLKHPFLNENF
jgi:mitogen-activated protein kinase kinase kinase 2